MNDACGAQLRQLVTSFFFLGGFGTPTGVAAKVEGVAAPLVHTEIDPAGTAEALQNAEKIMIVPGYGLAVAQAASVVADIALTLRKQGKEVKFAVHPVAGRMPGMNISGYRL